MKKVTDFEKRTKSYQVLKTYFGQKKSPLFATQISISYREQRQLCGTSPVTFAGKKINTYQLWKKVPSFENAPKVTKFWKRILTKKAQLFVTQKYSRLKSAFF